MQADSSGVMIATPSGLTSGTRPNASPANPDAVLKMLMHLGRMATNMSAWERDFCFDCTHVVESGEPLSNKQVAELKRLRLKYM